MPKQHVGTKMNTQRRRWEDRLRGRIPRTFLGSFWLGVVVVAVVWPGRCHPKDGIIMSHSDSCFLVHAQEHQSLPKRSDSKSRPAQLPSRVDYLVRDLDQIEPAFAEFKGTMYAGLIPTSLYMPSSNQRTDAHSKTAKEDPVSMDADALMFWLFVPQEPVHDDTLMVWMNGGPGCSSLGGALFEHGPVTIPRLAAGRTTTSNSASSSAGHDGLGPNPFAWTRTTAMLYVDQPVGTGFSQTNDASTANINNETIVGRDFYGFLQNFYDIFDNDWTPGQSTTRKKKSDCWRCKQLYITGESYAGMYVPSIAHYIYERNAELEKVSAVQKQTTKDNAKQLARRRTIALAGIAVGNGWMNALVQGPAVIDYAWWHGMIDTSTVQALHQEWDNCQHNSKMNHPTPKEPRPFHRFTVPDECGIMEAVLAAAGAGAVPWGSPNAYDVTTWDTYAMLDDQGGAIHRFFNNAAVQKALNIPHPVQWDECIPGAGRRRRRRRRRRALHSNTLLLPGQVLLAHDRPISVIPYVADLLDKAKIRVLIYSGDRDMTTNSQGSELLLDSMDWIGADGWVNEYERGLWLPNTSDQHDYVFGGYIKTYGNLEFLVVYNSGHLVPYNQDEIALDLVTRFLGNRSFHDKALPKFHVGRLPRKSPSKHDGLQESTDELVATSPGTSCHGLNVWAVSLCLAGFVVGFLASRGMQLNRRDYQTIPNEEK